MKEENEKKILVTFNQTEVEIVCSKYHLLSTCYVVSKGMKMYGFTSPKSHEFLLSWWERNYVQKTTNNETDNLPGGNKPYKTEQGEKVRGDGLGREGWALTGNQGRMNNFTLS